MPVTIYSAKETYNLKEPTKRSHPISATWWEYDCKFLKRSSPRKFFFSPNLNTKACAIEALIKCLLCSLCSTQATLAGHFLIAMH